MIQGKEQKVTQKRRITLFGMVAIALLAAACSGDSGNNSTEPEGDSSSSTTSLVVSSSSVKVQSSSSIPLSSSVEKFSSSSVVKFSSSSVGVLSSSSSSPPSSSGAVFSSSSVTKDWFNAAISYGSLTDTRDNQTYKTVVVGTQTWMAENLNFDTLNGTGSWCYNNLASNCATYGRLYDWSTVMAGSVSSATSPSRVQGICPSGWHVPSDAEWMVLTNFVGGARTAGTKLKANSSLWSTNTGTDDYGFSALPGGYYYGWGFNDVGHSGIWWTATEYSSTRAYYWGMYYVYAYVYSIYFDKSYGFSLRCIKD